METQRPQPGQGPLYRQVRERLVRDIAAGHFPPGEPLPSEQRLAERFGVAQGTVRRALEDLRRENLVVRQQGKGTFVRTHDLDRARFHFFHLVTDDGARRLPTSRVLGVTRRRANQDEALKLDLTQGGAQGGQGGRVIAIERVRDLQGRPAIFETVIVPQEPFADLATIPAASLPNTLYMLFQERFGVSIHRAVEKIRAVAAGPDEVRHLGMDRGAPLLEIERLALTFDGQPVELRISRCDTRDHAYLSDLV